MLIHIQLQKVVLQDEEGCEAWWWTAPSLQIVSKIEFHLFVNPLANTHSSNNNNSSNYNNNQSSSLRQSKNQNDHDQQLRVQGIAILPKRTIMTTKNPCDECARGGHEGAPERFGHDWIAGK